MIGFECLFKHTKEKNRKIEKREIIISITLCRLFKKK